MIFTRPASGSWFAWGGARTPGGRGGGLSPDWFEGGEGVPTNPSSHLVLRRGQKMQIAPIHHQHAKNGSSFHAVSGPWTSFVAALDKGRFNIAVCRRYTPPIGPPSCCSIEAWEFPTGSRSFYCLSSECSFPGSHIRRWRLS